VHGTWGATVESNLCYYTHGHAFYMEDAIEHNNNFVDNLVVQVRKGPMICTDSQIGPSAFWITNPNNTFSGNQAVDIGDDRRGIGYWIISGGDKDKETGPLTWERTSGPMISNRRRRALFSIQAETSLDQMPMTLCHVGC